MLRELDKRESGDDEICLLWDNVTDTLFIEAKTAYDYYRQEIPRESARDAFEHPWLYLRHPLFETVPTAAT